MEAAPQALRRLRVRLTLIVGAWLGTAASAALICFLSARPEWRTLPSGGLVSALGTISLATQAAWWTMKPVYEVRDTGLAVRVWPWKPEFWVPWDRLAWHAVSSDRARVVVSLGGGKSRECTLAWLSRRDRDELIALLDRRLREAPRVPLSAV